MKFDIRILLVLIPVCAAQSSSSKWVWSGRGRSDNTRIVNSDVKYNEEIAGFGKTLFQSNSNLNDPLPAKYRYEVTEEPLDITTPFRPRPPEQYRPRPPEQYKPQPPEQYRPRPPEQYRPRPPEQYRPRPPEQYRPDQYRPQYPYRPTYPVDYYRPTRPHENEFRPIGNGYRPTLGNYSFHGLRPGIGTNGRPILTGPTPSWIEEGSHKYKDYDVCKCVHSFNCNTPGIKFGSCDVDKQYCCYKSKPTDGFGKPSIYERPRPRPVLAGPGGPVDFPKGIETIDSHRPLRPQVDSGREFEEAYKKGLASAIRESQVRPGGYDRDFQQLGNQYDRDTYYTSIGNQRPINPLKYGLYDPLDYYGRSTDSQIRANEDIKI